MPLYGYSEPESDTLLKSDVNNVCELDVLLHNWLKEASFKTSSNKHVC